MKNNFKRLTAALFSAALTASLGAAAIPASYAADYTVTINQPEGSNDEVNHTYYAYQVFTGDLHGTGANAVLSNINWGSGVNGAALLAALKASSDFGTTNPFAEISDTDMKKAAQAVAEVIDTWESDSSYIQKFADIVGANLADNPTVQGTSGNKTLTMTAPGYYFIKDKDGSLADTNGAYTDYILRVVDSVTITAKEDVPTITKKIVVGDELKAANTASIDDVITFQLDSVVPDMSAYDKYFFVINDDMDKGLTFDPTSVKVYIADEIKSDTNPISSGNYEVQTAATDTEGHTFQIVMKDFKANYGNRAGEKIKVTYTAKLNENADRTETGNVNGASLTYSNNPNVTQTGDNEPSGTDPKGITPESQTKTYTTGILLKKIDGSTKEALTGVTFELKGSGVNKVIVSSYDDFKPDNENGIYYKLSDGTFTLTAPKGDGSDASNYADTNKYSLELKTETHQGEGENSSVSKAVDSKGMISFAGLGTGTYTLTETVTPDGYNTISPIEIVITANPTFEKPNWTVTRDGQELTDPTGIYEFTVENNKGVTLPGTGGIGTTLFYIVGGLMVTGAFVLLIVKKRMNIKEK